MNRSKRLLVLIISWIGTCASKKPLKRIAVHDAPALLVVHFSCTHDGDALDSSHGLRRPFHVIVA